MLEAREKQEWAKYRFTVRRSEHSGEWLYFRRVRDHDKMTRAMTDKMRELSALSAKLGLAEESMQKGLDVMAEVI